MNGEEWGSMSGRSREFSLIQLLLKLSLVLSSGMGSYRIQCLKTIIRELKLTLRLLMSYIYGAPILDVSRSHTTTHHSR